MINQRILTLYTIYLRTNSENFIARKNQRQFILATHNPNIAIAGDTDYSIVLEGTSELTGIKASGGIDDEDTQKGLLIRLEGGKEAFLIRQNKLRITKK